MTKYFLTLFSAIFIASFAIAQSSDLLLRHPALSPDGSQVAFSWQGDIWTVNANGGEANRLTIHEAYEAGPQWSPDGQSICFTSNRFGNTDVFSIQAKGGAPNRITYHSTSDGQVSWGADGNIYFVSRRSFAQIEREYEIHAVRSTGGTPTRIMDALGFSPVVSPDGRYIAFERGSCRIAREAYNGPANRDIWVFDTKTGNYNQITTSSNQDIYPDWGPGNLLYFVSARSGKYNLYSVNIAEGAKQGEPQRLTNFKDDGIRYYDVSADGNKIVLERGMDLYLMNTGGKGKPSKINVSVSQDYRFDPIEKKTFTDNVRNYNVSPNGKLVALNVRGDIVVKQNDKEKKRTKVITNDAAREENPQWLNDTTLLFVSDRKGNKDIYLARSTDTSQVNLYKTFKSEVISVTGTPEEEARFLLSPDRKKILILRGRGMLLVADIDENGVLTNEETLIDGWDTPSGASWSPDSKWVAYALEDLNFNSEIYIHAADNSMAPVNVSMHPRNDYSPVWSADGSKLAFVSDRNNADNDIWFTWLTKKDWEKTKRDWEDDEDEEDKKDNGKKNGEKKDSTETFTIDIDFEGIHDRLEQVTAYPGNEGGIQISKDGETFYFSANGSGRNGRSTKRNFMSIKWDGSDSKVILDDMSLGNLQWDEKQKNLYFVSRGKFSKLPVSGKKVEGQPFSAKLEIDHQGEKAQIFEDGWRALRDGFYDPEFHGKDWEALKAKYKKRALAASTSQDFRVMFNEMLGQLNASHMGMYGSDPEKLQRDQTGLLGIELKPLGRQGVQITSIIPDSPADRENSKLEVGEIISSINGISVNGDENFYELLEGAANERTLLTVKASDGTTREVVIRPATSLNTEKYEAWIKEQKRLTDLYSNGQLGYIHIRAMGWTSFERFERELMASGYGKKGIVIDVRFNGGGWTTDMVMAVLSPRQHAYTIPRGAAKSLKEHKKFKETYPYAERLPFPPLTLPSVALCNQNSYSNAEIFSHAYKTLGFGTLVGQPTFGAVISTGGYGLVDGSYVRMPFRAWFVKATEENMEHGPAVPDVLVENAPDSKANGKDDQLKKAVEILLEQIDK